MSGFSFVALDEFPITIRNDDTALESPHPAFHVILPRKESQVRNLLQALFRYVRSCHKRQLRKLYIDRIPRDTSLIEAMKLEGVEIQIKEYVDALRDLRGDSFVDSS